MSVITITPVTLAAGQRARIAGDAVISAYINELAGTARAEVLPGERRDAVREAPEPPHAAPVALAA
jgi:hypothetical protein